MQYRKYWIALGLVMAISFAVLIFFGTEIYRKAPPIPEQVVTTDGVVVFTDNIPLKYHDIAELVDMEALRVRTDKRLTIPAKDGNRNPASLALPREQ